MSIVVSEDDSKTALSILEDNGENPYIIGQITQGPEKIRIA